MRLGACSESRENNFDVLRLGAAVLVLASHSFVVTGMAEPRVGRWPLGTLGVEIFFAISGFLIAKSWLRGQGLRPFAFRRALRILPALVLAVVACAFVLGPLTTDLSRAAYLHDPAMPGYVADNLLAVGTGGVAHHIALDLPGVFSSNPSESVNVSLWTLPVETKAYALLALLGIARLFDLGLFVGVVGLFLLSISPASIADVPVLGAPLDFMRGAEGLAAHLLAIFFVSALFYRYRARIPMRADLGLIALLALVVSIGTPLERLVLVLAVPYLVLSVAYRSSSALRQVTRPGDLSYGIYLLAFPVQQTIVHLWGDGRPAPVTLLLIALPITYLLALLSWHGVEKRALGLKSRLAAGRREARPVPMRCEEEGVGDDPTPKPWMEVQT
jgi:peptidoglycan/LPS O-acetylase OafA/YrhL